MQRKDNCAQAQLPFSLQNYGVHDDTDQLAADNYAPDECARHTFASYRDVPFTAQAQITQALLRGAENFHVFFEVITGKNVLF